MEYATVFVCLVAALLIMQNYITRGMHGRYKVIADQIGEPYSPTHTNSTSVLNYQSTTITTVETLSEQQYAARIGEPVDFDGDGVFNEADVFATETLVEIPTGEPSISTTEVNEHVGPI